MTKKIFIICVFIIFAIAYEAASENVVIYLPSSGEASAPEWVGEAGRYAEASDGASTSVTVDATIEQGNTAVVLIGWHSSTQTLTSVTDSQSNTYTIHEDLNHNSNENVAIASAYISTALTSGVDTITATWGSPAYTYRGLVVEGANIQSSGQPDQSATGSGTGTSVSASASTSAANTLCVGAVKYYDSSVTYGSSNWTVSGSIFSSGDSQLYVFYTEETTAGSKDPGGTMSASENWGVVWAAFD